MKCVEQHFTLRCHYVMSVHYQEAIPTIFTEGIICYPWLNKNIQVQLKKFEYHVKVFFFFCNLIQKVKLSYILD